MRHSAEDREKLIREQAQSGMTKRAFCAQRHIRLGTFYAWKRHKQVIAAVRPSAFAQVEIAACSQAEVEVMLPNGARIGIRQQWQRNELVALIRGVAGYEGGT